MVPDDALLDPDDEPDDDEPDAEDPDAEDPDDEDPDDEDADTDDADDELDVLDDRWLGLCLAKYCAVTQRAWPP